MLSTRSLSLVLASSFPDYTGLLVLLLAALGGCVAGMALMVANLRRAWRWARVLGVLLGAFVCLCALGSGWLLGFRMEPLAAVALIAGFVLGLAQIAAVPYGIYRQRRRHD